MEALLGELWVPSLICFLIGVVFCIVEMLTPGFGAAGVLGFAGFVAVFIMQIVGNKPVAALIVCAVIMVVILVLIMLFIHSFQSGKLSKSKIVLQDNIESNSTPLNEQDYQALVGKEGVTVTPLRPAGIADIEGRRVDVQTYGNFIEAGQKIIVVAVENLRIIVK